jgi:NAD(P)-dependent dehydrogenase (short-subunit alcohol dehydrogenase family)
MSVKRTAIVTGGASGIGAACVRRFLKDDITVVALDLNEDLLNKMQGEIGDPNLHIVAGNVCDEKARAQAIELAVKHGGSLDILVNNAAIFLLYGVDATHEHWQKTFEVNLLAGADLVTPVSYTHLTLPTNVP